MSRAPNDAGFSLIEALVALAVFATAGVGLVGLQAHSIQTLSRVETRALASIVAENRLVETVTAVRPPDLGETRGEEDMGGRRWRWRQAVTGTSDALTRRITVAVVESEAPDGPPASLKSAFISVTDLPQ